MVINDLVGKVLRPLGLAAAMYGCGGDERQGCRDDYDCREPRVCVRGYCEDTRGGNNGGNGGGDSRCDQLCERVWQDCDGLPKANYNFGESYTNCLQGCPSFLEGVNSSPYAKEFNESIDCIISTSDCALLEMDRCDMDEGDLFSRHSS